MGRNARGFSARVVHINQAWSVGVGSFFPEGNLFRSEGLDIGFGRISFHNAHDVPGCANRATLSTSHCRHDLTRPAPLSMWSRMLHNAPALLASITEGISSTRNPGSPPNQLQILKPPPRSSAVEESGNCGSCGLQFQLLQPSLVGLASSTQEFVITSGPRQPSPLGLRCTENLRRHFQRPVITSEYRSLAPRYLRAFCSPPSMGHYAVSPVYSAT